MALTFYYGSGSPYAWRVWLALEYKRIPYEMKILSFSAGDHRKPEFLAINPRHRVPAIVDDGFALYESAAITEYLDEKYPGPERLFPADVRERAIVRRLIREADEYFAHALETLVDEVLFKPQEAWDAARVAAGRSQLAEELSCWESLVRGDYLAGALSAADFALYPQIALTFRMEKKKPDLAMRSIIGPRIAAWLARMDALALVAKTWPPHWK